MKLTRLYAAALALPLAASLGCEEDSEVPFKACEKGNYSIVTVTFGATTVRHAIRIVYAPTRPPREKIIAIGKSSDTVRVRAGTYPISIASIDSTKKDIRTFDEVVVTESCDERTIGVTF